MAARESQGLQIAVIIFAMLTIVLAITTYVFYSQSQQAEQAKRDAESRRAASDQLAKKLLYQLRASQFVLGEENVTKEMVDASRNETGEDQYAANVLRKFDEGMALYGDQAAVDGPRNWTTLPQYLLSTIASKQIAMTDATTETKSTQAKSAADIAAEAARTKVADDAKQVAVADLAKERQLFDTQRGEITTAKDALVGQIADKEKALKKERDDRSKDVTSLSTQLVTANNLKDTLSAQIAEINSKEVNRFETPDGRITWVNQGQRFAWINVGSADGLRRQTTFTVFNHDENGVTISEPKGRIEVIRVVGEHLAECRILEDKASAPLLPNDVIYTPAWSPGQVVRFALVGFMDINGDGDSDRELVRSLIELNGGKVEAEIKDDGTREGQLTVNTRYVVMGDKPNENTSKQALDQFTQFRNEITKFGTETISLQKFLGLMGSKTEERTVQLGKSAGASEFKSRQPKAKTPAPAAPAAAAGPAAVGPAPAAKPAAEIDPFK